MDKYTCADRESFVRRGPTLTRFFLDDEESPDPYTIISGSSSARQRNANDGQTVNAGLVEGIRPNIARKPYILVIFNGGGGSGPPAPLDPRMMSYMLNVNSGLTEETEAYYLGLVARKPVFGVSVKASFKPVSSATETS